MKKFYLVLAGLVLITGSVFANQQAEETLEITKETPKLSPTWNFIEKESIANNRYKDSKDSAREFFNKVDRDNYQRHNDIENDRQRRYNNNNSSKSQYQKSKENNFRRMETRTSQEMNRLRQDNFR